MDSLDSLSKMRKEVLVWLLVISLASFVYAWPIFDVPPAANVIMNATEDVPFLYYLNTTDGGPLFPPTIFEDTAVDVGFNCFYKEYVNDDQLLLNFTPDNDCVGIYSFTIVAKNSNVPSAGDVLFISFNVTNSNDPPFIVALDPPGYFETSENVSMTLSVLIDDVDRNKSAGDNFTYIWYLDGVLSPKLTFTKFNETYSNATYLPLVEDFDAGTHNITVIINDSRGGVINHTWLIGVDNVNRPPTFVGLIGNVTWKEDNNLTFNISLMDFFVDPDLAYDNDTNTWRDIDTDDVAVFDYDPINVTDRIDIQFDTGGNVSFYPDPNWYGNLTIRFFIDDTFFGGTAYSNYIKLEVLSVNDAPVIAPFANQTTRAYTLFEIDVDASDAENDTIVYNVSSPGLANITIHNESGLMNLSSVAADVGNHTVNVTASDGMNTSSFLFNLEVIANNRPDIVPFLDLVVVQYSDFNITVNGTDADGEALTFTTNFVPLNPGVMNNATSWNFSFTPSDQIYVMNHTIIVTVEDIWGSQNTFTFNLEVLNYPDPPTIYPQNITDGQLKVNTSFTLVIRATDPDANIDQFSDNTSLFDIVTGGTGDDATGTITFTPNQTGSFHINISVNDSTGLNDSFDLTFDVVPNAAPYFISTPNIWCEAGQLCEHFIWANDSNWQDVPNLNYSDNVTQFNISSTGWITYTPILIEVFWANITVSDGSANVSTVIFCNISDIDDRPIFLTNITNMSVWNNLIEGQRYYFNISVYDEENATIQYNATVINFTDLNGSFWTGVTLFNFSSVSYYPINNSAGWVNFSPSPAQVGHYWMNISASDGFSHTSVLFNFTVQNINNPPVVNWTFIYPWAPLLLIERNATSVYINRSIENTTLEINVSAFDYDFNSLSYYWYKDDGGLEQINIGEDEFMTYTIPMDGYPTHNLILEVRDSLGATTNITWILNVTNVNRNITFGTRYYHFNASNGTYIDTEEIGGRMQLEALGGANYETSGTFISESLDFQFITFNLDSLEYYSLNYTNYNGNPSQFNVTISTSTNTEDFIPSPSSFWDVTIDNISNRTIRSDDSRYMGLRFEVESFNPASTPIFGRTSIYYGIADQFVTISEKPKNWLDLDHFFDDLDDDDAITYGYVVLAGNSLLNVSIVTSNYVEILFIASGVAQMYFTAQDPFGTTARSNLITITIDEEEDEQKSGSGGSSGGSSVMIKRKYRERHVPEPLALDIIHPENVTFTSNKTIRMPITLRNSDQFDFKDLVIDAFVDRPGLEISLDRTEIDSLPKDEQEVVMLTMNVTDIYDSYSIFVSVNVSEPPYQDTAKIQISSLKRLKEDQESQKLKLSFVQDLLSKNKECQELTEYITRAKQYYEEGAIVRGDELLENFINDCKVLINDDSPILETPTGNFLKELTSNRETLVLGGVIVAVILGAIIFGVVMLYKKV